MCPLAPGHYPAHLPSPPALLPGDDGPPPAGPLYGVVLDALVLAPSLVTVRLAVRRPPAWEEEVRDTDTDTDTDNTDTDRWM